MWSSMEGKLLANTFRLKLLGFTSSSKTKRVKTLNLRTLFIVDILYILEVNFEHRF